MHVRHPVWLGKFTTPGAESFALLFALESFSRALLTSVIPLQALRALGGASEVSVMFFFAATAGLLGGLLIPVLIRRSARRWVYSLGALLLAGASGLLAMDGIAPMLAGMSLRVLGVVSMTVCINLYIIDNIPRQFIIGAEPKRMFYSAGAWMIGPAAGVYLQAEYAVWAPYAASGLFAMVLLGYFWYLRLTEQKVFKGRPDRAPGVWDNLRRFSTQPRLVFAWWISFGRSAWWAMFFIYTPIYAIQAGLGDVAAGLLVSAGTAFLFLMPLFSRLVRRIGIRNVLLSGFSLSSIGTGLVAVLFQSPWLAAASLIVAALAMVSLDAVGNVPFLLAVRPHGRAEMTAVYSTYRDAAELGPPGLFAVSLMVFELPAIYIAGSLAMLALAGLSRKVHPRFGRQRREPLKGRSANRRWLRLLPSARD